MARNARSQTGEAAPRRWVLLAGGRPVLNLGPRGRTLITFPAAIRDEEGALPSAIETLRRLPKGASRGMLVIEKICGTAAEDSPLRQAFLDAGYAPDYRGLIDVRPPRAN